MFRYALKSLRANLTRLVATALAVIIGITFLASGLMLTDAMRTGLTADVERQFAAVDLAVQPNGVSDFGGIATVPTEVLEQVAARITERHGVTVEVRPVDLADPPQRAGLADELAGRNISILCANAGTATFGPVAKLDPAGEKAQVQLNVLGVHDLVLAVLPGMLARRAGGILISGSAAGNSPIPNNATYAASKAFANTFSESLRGELKGSGVHVTLLAPGPVRTEMPNPDEASLVDRLIPDFLWISVEHTAQLSLDGLENNKMRVVPGLTSKAMSVASGYAPRAIVTPIVGLVYKKLGGG